MKPGIYHGLSIETYHNGSYGISKSGLDDIARSPKTYHALHLDPDRPPRVEKAGQLEGNLAHCAVLEPDEFLNRYVVGPNVRGNTTEWKNFVADHPDHRVIKPDQYSTAIAQARAVRRLPDVYELLSSGEPEVSAYWIDDGTGELCRCRPDWVHPTDDGGVILVDLKTYSSAAPDEFKLQVARKRYECQAAFYSDGYARAAGVTVHGFVFVAVESDYPFGACAFMLDEDSIEAGRDAYQRDLEVYAECRRTGIWPGYSASIALIRLPRWALERRAA